MPLVLRASASRACCGAGTAWQVSPAGFQNPRPQLLKRAYANRALALCITGTMPHWQPHSQRQDPASAYPAASSLSTSRPQPLSYPQCTSKPNLAPHNPPQARRQQSERCREECDPRRKRKAHQTRQDRILSDARRQVGTLITYLCGSVVLSQGDKIVRRTDGVDKNLVCKPRLWRNPTYIRAPSFFPRSLSHLNKRVESGSAINRYRLCATTVE